MSLRDVEVALTVLAEPGRSPDLSFAVTAILARVAAMPLGIHEHSSVCDKQLRRSITGDGSAARTRAARPRWSCRNGTR
jgi:hypothetical protein